MAPEIGSSHWGADCGESEVQASAPPGYVRKKMLDPHRTCALMIVETREARVELRIPNWGGVRDSRIVLETLVAVPVVGVCATAEQPLEAAGLIITEAGDKPCATNAAQTTELNPGQMALVTAATLTLALPAATVLITT